MIHHLGVDESGHDRRPVDRIGGGSELGQDVVALLVEAFHFAIKRRLGGGLPTIASLLGRLVRLSAAAARHGPRGSNAFGELRFGLLAGIDDHDRRQLLGCAGLLR